MTNQIPEEDRKKIEDKYPSVFIDRIGLELDDKNYSIKRSAAEFGYTLGIQSAEKRVKEYRDALENLKNEYEKLSRDFVTSMGITWNGGCQKLLDDVLEKPKQLLSK